MQTSMQRPDYDAAVNVVGTVNVLGAAPERTGDLRLVRRRRLRRVRRARRRAGAVPAALAVRHRQEVRRGVPRRLEPHPRHARTSSLRFANVYGPRQDAGLEGGVVAIFLERLARGDETMIFGDGAAQPRLRLRRRHRRLAARDRRSRRRPVQRRHRPRHDGRASCTRRARGSPAATRRRGTSRRAARRRAALGDRLAADRARARLVGASVSLDDGLARTWAWMQEHAAP